MIILYLKKQHYLVVKISTYQIILRPFRLVGTNRFFEALSVLLCCLCSLLWFGLNIGLLASKKEGNRDGTKNVANWLGGIQNFGKE